MPAKQLRRAQSASSLCTKSHHPEVNGTLQSEAEWIYYGFISGKFTPHETLLHARFLQQRDPESYEYLKWLGKRYMWPFVHGDVLKPNAEKWNRPRIYKTRGAIGKLLQ